jgi:predicted AlkP superfamily phosphohydrolase/phosphomutase
MSKEKISSSRRTLILGVDGATLQLIRPWAEAGKLPTFQRLMEQGASGVLESTMPPVTPAAWSSLATGMNQGKHGLFDFFGRRKDSYETYLVNSTHRHGAPLWQLLGKAGHRVTVFNVPATYPPEQVNGLMVSGLLTPSHGTDASWPKQLVDEIRQAVPDFSFYPPGVFSRGEEAKFVNDVLAWDRMTLAVLKHLMLKEPWDFLFGVFIGVDIVSHFMWRYMATQGESVEDEDPATKELLTNAIQRVYQQVDEMLAELLQAVGDDTYVMIVSDHGFGPLDYYMHLNTLLVEKGYLHFKRSPYVMGKHLAHRMGVTPLRVLETLRALNLGGKVQQTASQRNDWLKSMVKRAFLSITDIDWSRTTAYSVGYGAPIFVNLKGRQPHGVVNPGAEYEELLTRIIADLHNVRHPVTGELYFGEIYRPADLYNGPFIKEAPDLLPLPRDWCNQGYGVHDFASNRWLEPSPDRTGTHRMDGILLFSGPGIVPGAEITDAHLWDIAPTVLALMGVPIPTVMDGHVISSPMSTELRQSLSIQYEDTINDDDARSTSSLLDEDERLIRERLDALGYLNT